MAAGEGRADPPVHPPLAGIMLVDKPAGVSSHAVVAGVRRAFGIRKVGHAGTLDPDATGLLVIGIGRATRLLGYLTASDKAYTATIRLGATTETDDAAGRIVDVTTCRGVTDADIHRVVNTQRGTIDQVPSAVSAVKVEGRRAYARIRAGETVELAPRRVTIHTLDVEDIRREISSADPHGDEVIDIDIEVTCSAGTYIRAIARDVGAALGVGGHVRTLRRTRSGDFDIGEAHGLDAIAEAGVGAERWLIPMRDVAIRAMPHVLIDEESAQAVRHGRRITWPGPEGGAPSVPMALIDDGTLVGIAANSAGKARYLAVFD